MVQRWMNYLEMANEFLVLTSTYFLFIYSDGLLLKPSPKFPQISELVKDKEVQSNVGWFHVGVLGILVTMNLLAILTVQTKELYRKIKIHYYKRRF